jgi:uncharacterized membrane protein YgdD (TMEM256/DUF423 family)
MSSSNRWLILGALLAGLSVAAGAFGAHGLDRYLYEKHENETYAKKITTAGRDEVVSRVPLAQKLLVDFKTGAEYQMYHGLALLAVGILTRLRPSRALNVAGSCFLIGCLGFSGGLYAYALTGVQWFGMTIVPLGGVLFLAGWIALTISFVKQPPWST